MADSNFKYSNQEYGSGPGSRLKTVDVWIPLDTIENDCEKLWIIYVHGGAWRDAENQSETFKSAVASLSDVPWISSLAGFASINYRLSSYPTHPSNPSSPDDPARNVTHPAHLLDVSQALVYLNSRYNIDNRYMLAGHSAGATIIFQQGRTYRLKAALPQPVCILGIAGIYDFEKFRDNDLLDPGNKTFLDAPFPDTTSEILAFPASDRSLDFTIWQNSDALVLAHSDDDELVGKGQARVMMENLKGRSELAGKVHFLDLLGTHDEVHQNGDLLADLIVEALKKTRYGRIIR